MNRLEQYGVTINGLHTYRDLGLISVSPLFFNPSTIQKKTEDITGANGVLDYTDALTGHPEESSRTGEWKFKALTGNPFEVMQKTMRINGVCSEVVLDDDKGTSKQAWTNIKDIATDGVVTTLTVAYEVIDV